MVGMGLPDDTWDFIGGRFCAPAAPDGELSRTRPADVDIGLPGVPYALAQVDEAVAAARAAQPAFREAGQPARADLLRRYQAALITHRDAIADSICDEAGKPLWEARIEADAMAQKVDLCLGPGAAYTETERIPELPAEVRHRPLGVVAVVGPFNFPGHLPNGQIVPALLTGNAVVHKPSERTPATARWIAHCLSQAGLPDGVFNLVQGPAPVSAHLCRHPDVDGVLFTGSAAVGRKLVADNLDRLDRLVALELGGKNASIALADCQLEATARAVAFAAYATAGQRCTATSRLIVEEPIADALLARIAQLAEGLRIGHPRTPDTFMGPLISEDACQRLEQAQALARDAGYRALVEGGRATVAGHRGHYVRPALWQAPAADTFVAGYSDSELFAPDLAVYRVADRAEAIDAANRTRYGLSAAVFTARRDHFEELANALRVGVVHWNRSSAGASGRLPFGGVGESGNHRAAGIRCGIACTYPLSVLLEPENGPGLGGWPGFPDAP